MPEGHTIHRQVIDQAPHLTGHELAVTSPNRRMDAGAAAIDGRPLLRMDAWGKHLFYFFSGRRVLHIHLGLEGRFRHYRFAPGTAPPPPRRSAWIHGAAPSFAFDVTSPKVCEVIDEIAQRRIVERLGPDPIRVDDDGGLVLPRLQRYDGPIGVALLDQSLVAGIGNVYRAEILFHELIHPLRPAGAIGPPEWDGLWATSVQMLRDGVRNRGDIVTVDPRDLRVRDRRQTYLYGQRFCVRCGSAVRRWDLAGRIAYACETCQMP